MFQDSIMMPAPSITEFGMPIQTQMDAPHHTHMTSRPVARSSHPRGLITPTDLTLSEVLAKTEWETILPPFPKLSKHIETVLLNQTSKYNKILNIINFIASFFFLTGAIGTFYRFWYYQNNYILNQSEPDSESGRVITGGFFYLGSFIITICSAIINLVILYKIKKNTKQRIEIIKKDYEPLRAERIKNHKLKQSFFSILEIIYQLKSLNVINAEYYTKFGALVEKLEENFKRINLYPTLVDPGVTHITSMPIDTVIFKLKQLLLSREFEYVINKITKYLTKNILEIINKSIFSTSYDPIKDGYLDNIKHDFYTRCMLLDAFAEISIMKRKLKTSHLLIDAKIIKERTLSTTVESLREYWMEAELSDKSIYPFDLNIEKLAEFANSIIRVYFPALILQRLPLPYPLPMYLPQRGSSPFAPVSFYRSSQIQRAIDLDYHEQLIARLGVP